MSDYKEYWDEEWKKCITDKNGNRIDCSKFCTCFDTSDWYYDLVLNKYIDVCELCSYKCENKEQMDKKIEWKYRDPKKPYLGCFNCNGCRNIVTTNGKRSRQYPDDFISEDIGQCNKCNCYFQNKGDDTTYMDDLCPRCNEQYCCPFGCEDDYECEFCFKDCKKKNDPSYGYACDVFVEPWDYCDSCKDRFSNYVTRKERDAGILIQRQWRKCRYDPKYKMCERVQTRNLELIMEDN